MATDNDLGEGSGSCEAPRDGNVFRQAKTLACEAADDMIDAGEEIATSPVTKKIAAGAAVGALVAAPLPIIGWAAGATIGAGLVAFKHLRNKG
jgi:hypothetical protein